jgi:hypothetical protein
MQPEKRQKRRKNKGHKHTTISKNNHPDLLVLSVISSYSLVRRLIYLQHYVCLIISPLTDLFYHIFYAIRNYQHDNDNC